MLSHKCCVNLFSWLPWSFCSHSSLFRGQVKAAPLSAVTSHRYLFPGCQYLVSNCGCLCQWRSFSTLLKLLAPRLLTSDTLTAPTPLCFPKCEKFLSTHRITKWYFLLSICFYLLSSEPYGRATDCSSFGSAARKLNLLEILEGGVELMVCMFVYYF